MAEQQPKKEPDLLDSILKPLVDRSEQFWSEIFSQVLGSEKFAELMGQTLRGQLFVQKVLHEQLDLFFKALNLPSRRDLVEISRSLDDLKEAVARLEASKGRDAQRPRRRKATMDEPSN